MRKFLKELFILSTIFLILDIIWVGLIMNNHYSILLKEIQGEELEFKVFPVILYYIALFGGFYYFVIMRMKRYFNVFNIFSLSIPFAITVYGVFDFTSASMLKKWDYFTAFVDIFWGCFVCSFSAIAIGLYRKYSLDDDENNFAQNLLLN